MQHVWGKRYIGDLVRKPEGKKGPLGRRGRRSEDNIKMEIQEVGWRDVEWIYLARDSDRWRSPLKALMNLRFHEMWGIS